MNKPPAFQFYADDFLGGTIHFTDAEVGLYIRLLCVQWSTGGLPDDDAELASYSRGHTSIARVKTKFRKCDDGLLRNERLEEVRREQDEFRANRSESGKLGASMRWHSHSTAIAQPMPSHRFANGKRMANDSSPSPSPSPTDKAYKGTTKPTKLSAWQKEIAEHAEGALGLEWINDAGKWINRIKADQDKVHRVMCEVVSAAKEGAIKTTPAAYAEECWKRFQSRMV